MHTFDSPDFPDFPWFPSPDHSLGRVSCLALTPSCLLTTSRLSFQSSRSWKQMSHLHTERFVFWKCEDGGQRLLKKEVFDGCLLAVEPAFPKPFLKHYSTDYCTVVYTGFWDDQKKYLAYEHTADILQIVESTLFSFLKLFTLFLLFSLKFRAIMVSLDVFCRFIFISVTALTSQGAHRYPRV